MAAPKKPTRMGRTIFHPDGQIGLVDKLFKEHNVIAKSGIKVSGKGKTVPVGKERRRDRDFTEGTVNKAWMRKEIRGRIERQVLKMLLEKTPSARIAPNYRRLYDMAVKRGGAEEIVRNLAKAENVDLNTAKKESIAFFERAQTNYKRLVSATAQIDKKIEKMANVADLQKDKFVMLNAADAFSQIGAMGGYFDLILMDLKDLKFKK